MSALKRLLVIFICVAAVIATGVLVYFVGTYTGLFNKEKIDRVHVYEYETEDGRVYTKREFEWKPITKKTKITLINEEAHSIRIPLILSRGVYTYLDIPDVPIINDMGKTIYAEDGSFMIRVIGNTTMDNLSAVAGIDNGTNLNQFTIVTKEGKRGPRTFATLIQDSGVIINVFSGDDYFTTFYNSLQNGLEVVSDVNASLNGMYDTSLLEYNGMYAPSVYPKVRSMQAETFMFKSGYLYSQTVALSPKDAITTYLQDLAILANTENISQYYENDKLFVAQVDDWTLGILKLDSSASMVMIGSGDEAWCNIHQTLDSY